MRVVAENLCTVYGLADPRNPGEIRYVGITRHSLSCKLGRIYRTREGANKLNAKERWVVELHSSGVRPVILILETGPLSKAADLERKWYEKLKPDGKLLNGPVYISPGSAFRKPENAIFREQLLAWRGERTQKEAASELDVPLSTYKNWEYGINEPTRSAQRDIYRRILPLDKQPTKINDQ